MTNQQARRRRLIADEFRNLADQIEDGTLPEKGAVTELARNVDKQLNEMRPYRDPRARQRQAKRLGQMLSAQTGVEVYLRYEPTKHWRTGKPGYHKVRWSNGPTFDTMKAHVDKAMAGGRLDLINAATLALERDGGGRCELVALFHHLEAGADVSDHIRLQTDAYGSYHRLEDRARHLWDDTDYPEKLLDNWKPQLDALNELVVEHWRSHRKHLSLYDLLANKLREHGWPHTRVWLNRLATATGNPDAPHLGQGRTRPTPSTTPGL